ncbi:hypothetical protein [Fodinibius sediminis]|uniref:Lipoprotein n=1 Tax=Fodinibius sediminis TaxID=1214077 RepID=A0A521AKN7_9BACT|nr:hypothetical protein [Fodinibius sediminis]SMO35368.1 hypothetical protein SAMN06265218_101177 [Fodinibius sediminis]
MVGKVFKSMVLGCMVGLVVQGCAGTGGLGGSSGSTRTYEQEYAAVKKVVNDIVQNSVFLVISIEESEDNTQTKYYISKSNYVGEQQVNQHQGTIIVTGLAEGGTRVEVENPEYHYTVPNYEKEDYRREVFRRLEKALQE